MNTATARADVRLDELSAWVTATLDTGAYTLAPASADASFRRYFRITPDAPWQGHPTLIAMDAPPPMEDCRPFVHVARLLADAGLHAPEVLADDPARGFLLLTDLGARTYLAALDAQSAPALYRDATDALIRWQQVDARRRAAVVRRGAARARARALPRLVCRNDTSVSCSRPRRSRRSRARSGSSSTTISRSRACSSTATITRAT